MFKWVKDKIKKKKKREAEILKVMLRSHASFIYRGCKNCLYMDGTVIYEGRVINKPLQSRYCNYKKGTADSFEGVVYEKIGTDWVNQNKNLTCLGFSFKENKEDTNV